MCDVNVKTLASLLLSVVSSEKIKPLLDPSFVEGVQREVTRINCLPTDTASKIEKAENKPSFSYTAFEPILKNPSENVEKCVITFGGKNHCVYFVTPKRDMFCQPIYKKGYVLEGEKWLPSDTDLQNIIGYIPIKSCDYSSIGVKQQWMKKIAENAGTAKGIEAEYKQIFQDSQTKTYDVKPQPEAKPEAQPEAKPEANA